MKYIIGIFAFVLFRDVYLWRHGIEFVQAGIVQVTRKTGPSGFHLDSDALTIYLPAVGNLTTTIDGDFSPTCHWRFHYGK